MAFAQRHDAAAAAERPGATAVHQELPVQLHRPRPVLFDGMADPSLSVARAYRFERARRSLRSERRDERRRADRRFWVALGLLAAGIVAVAVATVTQLQQLFGI
mgnify:CR=1 FL=1